MVDADAEKVRGVAGHLHPHPTKKSRKNKEKNNKINKNDQNDPYSRLLMGQKC